MKFLFRLIHNYLYYPNPLSDRSVKSFYKAFRVMKRTLIKMIPPKKQHGDGKDFDKIRILLDLAICYYCKLAVNSSYPLLNLNKCQVRLSKVFHC